MTRKLKTFVCARCGHEEKQWGSDSYISIPPYCANCGPGIQMVEVFEE